MLALFLFVVSKRGLAIISTLFSRSKALNSKSSNRPLIFATCNAIDPAGVVVVAKFTLRLSVIFSKPLPAKLPATRAAFSVGLKIPHRTPSSFKLSSVIVTIRASIAICSIGLSISEISFLIFCTERGSS